MTDGNVIARSSVPDASIEATRAGSAVNAMIAEGSKPTQAVFRVRRVSKLYKMGEVEVFALRSVELAVILGASGSGKSTLLNIIGGLDVPTFGEVIYRDHNLTNATDDELTQYRRDHVGFVFQFYNLIPSLTALENVQLITEIAVDPMKAEDALAVVGLEHRLGHFPAQLSKSNTRTARIIPRNLLTTCVYSRHAPGRWLPNFMPTLGLHLGTTVAERYADMNVRPKSAGLIPAHATCK
jgi:ABC-type glutathione transport system ATPase component